jgi:ketosteroid isomerase-like protein
MSDENVGIVRRAYEAFAVGDLAEVLRTFSPDVVSYTAPPLPDAAEYHGHDGVLKWMTNWIEAFDDFVMEAEEYIDLGDRVVAGVRQSATGAGSGVPVENRFWLLHVLRDGRVFRIGIYATRAAALEAAGSLE